MATKKNTKEPVQVKSPVTHLRSTPIGEYGFLSDGEVSALVSPGGAVEWMCVPRFDSPSVFGSILGRHAGSFRIAPDDVTVPADVRYLPGTMILETSWGTPTGWIIVRDALLIGPWHHEDDRSKTYQRTPNDYEAEHILLRTIRCASGEVQTIVDCEPVFDYGRARATWAYTGDELPPGLGHRRGHRPQAHLDQRPAAGLRGRPGQRPDPAQGGRRPLHRPVLGRRGAPDHLRRGVQEAGLDRPPLAALAGPRQVPRPPVARLPAAQRADPQGPDLLTDRRDRAAGSTSLPETPGGERNYDYRYTWIRDATFALWGLYSLGFDWEAVDFFSFIADIASRDDHLQIMYGIGGERELEEYELDHLPGYANSRPVRIGNAAYSQNQHDVWGALLDSVYLHFKAADHVDGRIWPILDKQVNEALKYWREPDAGIWEVRGQLQHFTSSKIMCWVAVDRGAKIARISGEDGQGQRVGAGRPGDQGRHPGQRRRRARRADPVLRHQGAGRVAAAGPAGPLPAGRPSGDPGHRAGHRRRADRRRPGAALQGGGDRRRLRRRGGQLHHLLVLAGLGPVRDR